MERKLRILLVDDDALVSMGTAAMLEDLGHSVVELTSAAQALATLKSGPPVDLVITDHAMPGMTGLELADAIRQEWPHLPIILATGYAELPAGKQPDLIRLDKPYTADILATALRGAMHASS